MDLPCGQSKSGGHDGRHLGQDLFPALPARARHDCIGKDKIAKAGDDGSVHQRPPAAGTNRTVITLPDPPERVAPKPLRITIAQQLATTPTVANVTDKTPAKSPPRLSGVPTGVNPADITVGPPVDHVQPPV